MEVFVLGDAEEDEQVEDQHQGGEGGVATHLHNKQMSWQRNHIARKVFSNVHGKK